MGNNPQGIKMDIFDLFPKLYVDGEEIAYDNSFCVWLTHGFFAIADATEADAPPEILYPDDYRGPNGEYLEIPENLTYDQAETEAEQYFYSRECDLDKRIKLYWKEYYLEDNRKIYSGD